MVVLKSKIVLTVATLTIIVGVVVFGKFVFESRNIDRSRFENDKLKVLSYATFVSSFGPGPEVARQFKAKYGVDVELVNVGDSGLLIQKLKEDPSIYADVVFGIDPLMVMDAKTFLGWKEINENIYKKITPEIRKDFESPFIPITWSPMTFIYRKSKMKSANSLEEFLKINSMSVVSLQDPRFSTPGLELDYWFFYLNTDLSKLKGGRFRVSPSWSQSYGLFKRQVAQAVFTYLTSIVFHWENDADAGKDLDVLIDQKGHAYQVELAGVLDRCRRCEDAQKFISFLLEPKI